MGIKLSPADTPEHSQALSPLQAGFILALGGLITALKRVILPYTAGAVGLFCLVAFLLYHQCMNLLDIPAPFTYLLLAGLLLCCGAAAMAYALLLCIVHGLHSAAVYAEEFFYALFEALKDKIRLHIQSMDEGIAKQQAKVILDNSVREVLSPLKQLRARSVSAALASVLLAILTFVSRSVFLARLARFSGTTIQFSKLFASRATLVGALFLNMRWLSILLLWLLYGVGAIILLGTLLLVW